MCPDFESLKSISGTPSAKKSFREVSIFLFLIVPSMVLSFFAFKTGSLDFPLVAAATILRDMGLVALIFLFLSYNQEPASHVGWTARNPLGEIVLGLVLYVPFFFGTSLLENVLQQVGLTAPKMPLPLIAHGPGELLLAGLLVIVVAVSEETIFRGYLMLRFASITGSPLPAALISTGFFALGHGYEGTAGVATVGVMGFIFALVYLWRRSLVAPMVMHFCQDFIGIVVLSNFSQK
jgi:CAAX protease family protein